MKSKDEYARDLETLIGRQTQIQRLLQTIGTEIIRIEERLRVIEEQEAERKKNAGPDISDGKEHH
ncbi:MAG: hypothetical protein ACWGQW_22485 [bacterium]